MPSSRDKADKKVDLVIVVNGDPTPVDANIHAPLRTIVARVLGSTGNVGQPPENWELRDQGGTLLELDRTIGDFGLTDGTRLFLNLKAGVGG